MPGTILGPLGYITPTQAKSLPSWSLHAEKNKVEKMREPVVNFKYYPQGRLSWEVTFELSPEGGEEVSPVVIGRKCALGSPSAQTWGSSGEALRLQQEWEWADCRKDFLQRNCGDLGLYIS